MRLRFKMPLICDLKRKRRFMVLVQEKIRINIDFPGLNLCLSNDLYFLTRVQNLPVPLLFFKKGESHLKPTNQPLFPPI